MKAINRLAILLFVGVLGGVVLFALYSKSVELDAESEYVAPAGQPVQAVPFGDEKKLDAIRNRANIKKQQELIVQETYLTEEKAQIEQEKDAAIKKFDSDIKTVEAKLEAVRGEKVSFQ